MAGDDRKINTSKNFLKTYYIKLLKIGDFKIAKIHSLWRSISSVGVPVLLGSTIILISDEPTAFEGMYK